MPGAEMPRRRSSLLAGTAFSGAFIAVIAGNPQRALAACAGENTANVLCNAANPATAGTLNTSFAGTTVVNVDPGGAITSGGATATVTAPGSLTFNHNDPGGITSIGGTGVSLTNNFGGIAYLGNAAVSGGLRGVQTTTVDGLNTVNMTGGTVTASGTGILATSTGTGGINVNVTGGQIGGGFTGISAVSTGSAGNINIATSTPSVIAGIDASTAVGSSGHIAVAVNSPVSPSLLAGVSARSQGTGTVTVTGAGTVSGASGGISATGAGVGPGAGVDGVSVLGTGDTSAVFGGTGISARITNAANNSNIVVNRSGAISGRSGIAADTVGGGNVTVTTSSSVFGSIGPAIFTQTVDGMNTVEVTAGTVQGDILARASGAGSIKVNIAAGASVRIEGSAVTLSGGTTNTIANSGMVSGTLGVQTTAGTTLVTNAGSIIGTEGTAVRLGGTNNLFVMDGPGATLTGSAIGGGTDTFRLAGSGANSFDVSQIAAGWTLLDKAGASTWTLTGTATYTGAATVSAGTLLVNGSLASASGVTVASGATLGGSGTLPSVTLNGGTLAPGNSIGTVTIAGNLTVVGAGNYLVEVSPADADRTNVTGSAALAGSMTLVATGGTYTIGKQYVLLNAGGGISGTFNTSSTPGQFGAGINPVVSYDANNVLLTLDAAAFLPFLPPGTSANPAAVAGAIDTAVQAGNIPPLFLSLFGLPVAQLPAALNALSGEVHASTAGVLVDESRYVRNAVLGRLRQASYGGDARMAALSVGGPETALLDSALAYGKSGLPVKAPMQAPQATRDVVFWAQGFGAFGRFDGDGNAAAVRRDLAGFFSGVDARFGNWRGGAAVGYTSSRNSTDGRGTADVETGHVAAYGGASFGGFALRGGGAFAWHQIDTDRTIAFPGFADRATAQYNGHTGQIFGEVGYGFAFGSIAVEPFAGAAWVRLDTDAAAERATAAGLNIAATTFEVGYATLGIRAASLIPLGHDLVLIPRASAAWQHAFDDVTPATTLAFQAAPVPFVISSVPIARDALLAEAGLDLAIGRNATVGVSYVGQLASNVQDHAAKGKFSWRF